MILGAVCAGLACFLALQMIATAGPKGRLTSSELIRASTLSPVEWQLHRQAQLDWYQRWLRPLVLACSTRLHLQPARLDPIYLVQAGLDPERIDGTELRLIRLMVALGGALAGGALALLVSGSYALIPLLAWLGYIAPIRAIAARRRRRQASIERELPQVISMIRAFMAAGMPLERTLHVISGRPDPDSILKQEIRRALARYGLGLSIEQALQEIGLRTGVGDAGGFITALNQARRAGTGLDTTLRDQELMVRMNQRNRATAQASAVGTKLLAVVGGIYLPEFVILIIVPLFWGIMQRAFG
ncbi:MAG TPA: type II secretion system F family protein [Candidatus Acidoferrum sp.]|nr:type II secretion system F family protein [Candidatus Acidoferrum sp.]